MVTIKEPGRLESAVGSLWSALLLTSYFLLLTPHFLLLTSYFLRLTSCFKELARFKRGLASVNKWYGHSYTTVAVLNGPVPRRSANAAPYSSRGW